MIGAARGMAERRLATALAIAVAALLVAAAGPAPGPRTGSDPIETALSGKLLVAAPTMSDPRFRESVILMVDHNAQGAFGLIVNKPMGEIDTAKLFDRLGIQPGKKVETLMVFFGGPVEPQYSFVIHGPDFAAPDTRRVTDTLFISPESVVVAAMAQDMGPKRVVFAVGYTGWGPGQLESEMRRDDWFTAPADTGLIFGTHHDTKWKRALALRYRSL